MLEDELHQSAAGDTPPEPEAKESDAAVPAEETGSIPEKTTAAEPAEGDASGHGGSLLHEELCWR